MISYKQKKIPFEVWMAVQKGRVGWFSMPGYQLTPSDRSNLNWSIKEHRGMVGKLNVILKDLKNTIPHSSSPVGLL